MNKRIKRNTPPYIGIFLILGLAACSNSSLDTPPNKLPSIATVNIMKTTNKRYFVLSWDVIAPDVIYSIHFKQKDAISSIELGSPDYYSGYSYAQNQYIYNTENGDQEQNFNFDKWSARIDSIQTSSIGEYCFGIRTNSSAPEFESSEIKWSELFTVTQAPQVIAVYITKVTGGSYNLIANWDAVDGADSYSARQIFAGTSYSVEPPQNTYVYNPDGSTSTNSDLKKWSLRSYSRATQIGIIAISNDLTVLNGDIAWSNTLDWD
jgi:hypothetical protein